MTLEREVLSWSGFLALMAGDPALVRRLEQPCSLVASTQFTYPGRGEISVLIDSDGRQVRLSDGGRLLAYLDSQGLDVTLDDIMSRTVFHALRDVPGMAMGNGSVFLVTTPERVPRDLAAFVQTLIEIVGLRHSKYKDALVRLSQRRASEPPGSLL